MPMKSTAQVSVPATSGNVGPGFDVLGLALELRDTVSVVVNDEPGVRVRVSGEGAASLPTDESHLVARVLLEGLETLGVEVTGVDIHCENRIPQGKGLGSSAAAIVAGLSLAQLLVEDEVDLAWILEQATAYEGHPDNAAACIYGGLTLAWSAQGQGAQSLVVLPEVKPVVAIPGEALLTEKARGLLPESVPLADAAFNAGRTGLVIIGLTQDISVLLEATDDKLHQGYRRDAYPNSLQLVEDLRSAGIPACISGAGPAVLALTVSSTTDLAQRIVSEANFKAMPVDVSAQGIVAE